MQFLDFNEKGPLCTICGHLVQFIGCSKHEAKYPIVTDKSMIRIPNCPECHAECSHCAYEGVIPDYFSKIKESQKPKIKEKLKRKDPKVVFTKPDAIDKINFSNIKNINQYKNVTKDTYDILFAMDIGHQLALTEIKNLLKEGDVSFSSLEPIRDNLIKLLYTLLSIRSLGLGTYEKDIMKTYIEKLIGIKIGGRKDAIN